MLCAPTRLGGDLLTGLLFGLDSIFELHTGHGLKIYLKSIFGDKLPTHRKQPFAYHPERHSVMLTQDSV